MTPKVRCGYFRQPVRHGFDIVSGSCLLIQRNTITRWAYVQDISVMSFILDMSYFVERFIKECSEYLRSVYIRGDEKREFPQKA